MRIAYLVHGVDGRGSGVRAKILSQAETWAELRPELRIGLFVRSEAGSEAEWIGQPHVERVRASRAGIAGRLVQREMLSLEVARWRPDLIYLRQSTVSPSVALLAASFPTIVELNTLDLAELRIRSRGRYHFARATRGLVLRRARGLVAVTNEIAEHGSVRGLHRPIVTIPNGIDMTVYPPLAAPANRDPRLVFLGAPRLAWHGLDKISELARLCPSWHFDVIGPQREELSGHPPNVTVHGLLAPREYEPVLARADVALGPLALHRKRMNEASPLKVGEYLARGIPTIIGYADTRFPDGAPFLLQVPNSENNVAASLDRIRAFVSGWMGRRVDRKAIASIDSRRTESDRLRFMLRLAGD